METTGRRGRLGAVRVWTTVLTLGLLAGCASVGPRFDQAVTTSFARQPMRKLETARVELYYPEAERAEALRVVSRLDRCVELLRRNRHSGTARPKVLAYLTSANFDNAYVQPQAAGFPAQMVLAHHFTLEFFNLLEIGVNHVDDVSCHEAVHYVQFQEVDELWYFLNAAFGDLLDPNIGLETWFLEGLATQYEGRLEKATGRPHSPIWNGIFASGVALRQGDIRAGDLSSSQRELVPFGGNYVVGQQFIDWLARRYGADKLWELVDVQGRSWISFLGVSFRFMWVYGKGPGELVDEWRETLRRSGPWRERPAWQKTLDRDLGWFARLASAPDGTLAAVASGADFPSELRVWGPDGTLRARHALTRFLPGRSTVATSPLAVSGLSFSPDARRLYLVLSDVGIDGDSAPKLVELDVAGGHVLRTWETPDALGGGLTPDGTAYVFVRSRSDTADLWTLELASGVQRPLTAHAGRLTLGAPAPGPDGRIVFPRKVGEDFDLWLREADGRERALTTDGRFHYAPRWESADTVVALEEVEGRTQAVRLRLSDGTRTVLTDAPFVVLDPVPLPGSRLAFVNRDGWGWTLDRVDVPPPGAAATASGRASGPDRTGAQADTRDASAPSGSAGAVTGAASTAAPGRPGGGPEERTGPGEPAAPDVPVLADDPVSPIDHLLVPNLRVPFVTFDRRQRAAGTQNTVYGGLSLEGRDRLGLHQWAVNLGYETSDPGPTFSAGYGNYQLAPVYLSAGIARSSEPALREARSGAYIPSIVDMSGSLTASRSFWTTPLSLSFLGVHRTQGLEDGTHRNVDLLGPGLATSWSASESTLYAGVRRGIALSGSARLFAKTFGSDFAFADLRATAVGTLPLPLWARHTLQISVRGRALTGAPARLLRVGGATYGFVEAASQDGKSQAGSGLALFPDITFREYLRGYEDETLRTNQVVIAGVRYRAPLVVDRGWASVLWLLPSLFVRQVDLEAFGEWAHTWTATGGPAAQANHRTWGGAVFARTTWSAVVPLSFYYQVAVRPDDGLTPLHLFGIAYQ